MSNLYFSSGSGSLILNSNKINYTDGTSSLELDSKFGTVKELKKKVFSAYRDENSASYILNTNGTYKTYVYNNVTINTFETNPYNTSTGSFSVPYNGVYLVTVCMLTSNANTFATKRVLVNGTNRTARGLHCNNQSFNVATSMTQTFAVNCVVSDIITIGVETGSTGTMFHSSLSIVFYG